MQLRNIVVCVVLGCTAPLIDSAGAQESQTTQLWLDLVTEWYVHPKHLAELEFGPKILLSNDEAWRELTFTPAYEYSPNYRWDLVVSRVLLSWVEQTSKLSTFEIRPVLGFRIYILPANLHRLMIRDFNRVEGRFIYYEELSEWDDTYRYRNRLEFQYPINNPLLNYDRTWYAMADAEIFINLGAATIERFNDNWRFRVGAGYRLRYAWRFEFLYTLQITYDTLGDDFEVSNHILRTRLKHYF